MQNVSDYTELKKELQKFNNILITGPAGSGKTYGAIQLFKNSKNSVFTATTGIAALNVGGETLHRFLNLGTASRPELSYIVTDKWDKIKRSKKSFDIDRLQTILSLKTLIIDEASMLRRDTFELVDVVLSHVRENSLPFGGVQMVLVSDFFQLPPVVTSFDISRYPDLSEPYCFQSPLWYQAGFESFNLTTNYRQGDGEFLDALGQIRIGNVTPEIDKLFSSRVGANLNVPLQPLKLFSHKDDVSVENINCLKQLPGDKMCSTAEFEGKEYDINILKKECPAEVDLYFGKNAQVMMLTNDPKGNWVNGTMGIIKDLSPLAIKFSSGATFEITPFTWERSVPRVKFDKSIYNEVVAKMTQYPFRLSWSSTLHKCQGLTLDYVELDLSRSFACGQSYVGLSRVKTIEGLTLRSWNKSSIKTDKKVREFYGITNS